MKKREKHREHWRRMPEGAKSRSAEKKIAGGITSGFPDIKDKEEWKRC